MISRAQQGKQVREAPAKRPRVRKMAKGGKVRGCGAARRGKKFTRNG